MNCRQVDEHIFSYCDGKLAPSLSSEIDSHIADCADCRANLELTRLEAEILRSAMNSPALSDGFSAGVMAAIGKNGMPGAGEIAATKKRRPWYTRTPLWLAATAAAFLLLLYTVSPGIFSNKQDIARHKSTTVRVAENNPAANAMLGGRVEEKAELNNKEKTAASEDLKENSAKVMTAPADIAADESGKQPRNLPSVGSGAAGSEILLKRDSYPDRDRTDALKLTLPADATFGAFGDNVAPRISNMPSAYHIVNTANQNDTWTYFYEGNGQQIIISLNTSPTSPISNYAAPEAAEATAATAGNALETKDAGSLEDVSPNSVCRSVKVDDVYYQLTVTGELSLDDLNTLAGTLTVEK